MVDPYETVPLESKELTSKLMVALWDHPASAPDELSLMPGDIITVVEQPDEGWWVGELNNKIGLFPVAFCREVQPKDLSQRDPETCIISKELTQELPNDNMTSLIENDSFTEQPRAFDSDSFHDETQSSFPDTALTSLPDYILDSHNDAFLSQPEDDPHDSEILIDDMASTNLSYRMFHQLYLGGEADLGSFLDDSQMTIDYTSTSPNLPPAPFTSDSPLLAGLILDNEPILDLGRESPILRNTNPQEDYSSSSEDSQLGVEDLLIDSPDMVGSGQGTSDSIPPLSLMGLTGLEASSNFLENDVAETISLKISEDEEMITKEGVLSIKADQCTSGLLSSTKHWKQYWVVIKASALLIYKYTPKSKKSKSEDKNHPKFKGWFDLDGASALPAAKGQSKKRHVFCLNSKDSQVSALLQAEDENDYTSWLETLQNTIKTRSLRNSPASFISALPRINTLESPSYRLPNFRHSKSSIKKDKEGVDPLAQSQVKSNGSKIAIKPKGKMMGKLFSRPPQGSQNNYETEVKVQSDSVWYTLAGDSDCISYVVKRCVEELKTRNCLTSEGIYRLSGNAASIKSWKTKFHTIGPVSLSSEPDINVITGTLKLFFRELTEPLFPFEAYGSIVAAGRIADYDDRLWAMKDLIHSQLSKNAFSTLKFLITHLAEVAEESDVNLMAAQNLAIVFGPTLARPRDPTIHPQLEPLFLLVESLIIQHVWFFETDTETTS